jgi:hypothetical protein
LKVISLIFAICFAETSLKAQEVLKGIISENDSSANMPFVYVINKSNGNGTMSDNDGKFSLTIGKNDTLVCSFVGFAKAFVPVNSLKRDAKGMVRIVMNRLPILLNQVTVTSFKIKPYEREYMNKIIDESRIRRLDYAMSPFTALYMTYSKEGKQIRKLAKIFEDLLIDEQVQKKLSPEILRKLTGDDKIDYEAFRKYCVYLSNDFIMNTDGVELYSKVMDCYKSYKREKRIR